MEQRPDRWARLDAMMSGDRVRWYTQRIAIAYVLIWAVVVMSGPGLTDLVGRPKGTDFLTLYAAGRLTLQGKAHLAYELPTFQKERADIIGMPSDKIGLNLWPYPPPYFFIAGALAHFPYLVAYVLWVTLTLLVFLHALYLWSPSKLTTYVVLGAPAVFMNFAQGQTGFLMGAVLAYGLYLLERRPFWAGAVLGLLTLKPQFALAPFAMLLFAGRWSAVAGGVAGGAVLGLTSLPAFGFKSWVSMVEWLPVSMAGVSKGVFPLHKYATAIAFGKLLGAPEWLAWALQIVVAAGVLLAVVWVWRRSVSPYYRAAAMSAGVFLATPYAHDYDLAICLLAVVAIGFEMGARAPARRWEKFVLVSAYVIPVLGPPLAKMTRIQLMPLVLGALIYLIVRRVREDVEAPPADHPSSTRAGYIATGTRAPRPL